MHDPIWIACPYCGVVNLEPHEKAPCTTKVKRELIKAEVKAEDIEVIDMTSDGPEEMERVRFGSLDVRTSTQKRTEAIKKAVKDLQPHAGSSPLSQRPAPAAVAHGTSKPKLLPTKSSSKFRTNVSIITATVEPSFCIDTDDINACGAFSIAGIYSLNSIVLHFLTCRTTYL